MPTFTGFSKDRDQKTSISITHPATRFLPDYNSQSIMYKVVYTVVDVAEPKSVDGEPTHVSGPCKMYRVGDRMTVVGNPGRLVLEETDSVCLAAFSAILR